MASAIVVCAGCHDAEIGGDPGDYFDDPGSMATVSDPIEFTETPYDFSGEMTIAELRDLIPPQNEASVWAGFAAEDPYPIEGDCNPEFTGGEQVPAVLEELPAYIEGIVTLHPRYFTNANVCGSRERYYGTYIIQDETAGIHVLKNSRIGEFDVGDRVRLRVRAIKREFSMQAVLTFDNEEALTTPDDRYPVYYEEIERPFEEDLDVYQVRRISGEVVQAATNQNFNEMILRSTEDPDVEWIVSFDRELGTRGVTPPQGSMVQLTGPVMESFGMRMIIASLGKIEYLD